MKEVNARGPAVVGPQLPGLKPVPASDLRGRLCDDDVVIVDTRSKEAFAAAHIPRSLNIPLGPNLASWAGWMLPYDRPLVIVTAAPADVAQVVTQLLRVGYDQIDGHLEDGIDGWQTMGFPLARIETISVDELDARLKQGALRRPFVLDVRTDGEWDGGHIDGARHIHAGVLRDHLTEVPKERPVAVVCGSGYRGSVAASLLKHAGYENVTNVLGGMTAWGAAGMPTVA
jgi:hydroxyacylglutathione hydrolase